MPASFTQEANAKHEDKNHIVVNETVFYELKASSAVLHVTVKGTSYFADDAAMKKAKEVSALVDALKEVGLPENGVRLKNVVADTQSGVITKTSSAKYHLSIKCKDLDKLSETVAVITSSKSYELHKLDWQFKEDRAKRLEQMAKVFAAAKETGECIAQSLGVSIEAVHDCSYEEFGASSPTILNKMNAPDYESMERARFVPSLPTGQWQTQAIKARVVFQVQKSG